MMNRILKALAFLLWVSPLSYAQEEAKSSESSAVKSAEMGQGSTQHAFNFGLSLIQHHLSAYGDNDLYGTAGSVSLGYSYLAHCCIYHGNISLVMGPFEPMRQKQIHVDYNGTGFDLGVSVPLPSFSFERGKNLYGVSFALSYVDTVGKSIGKNRHASDDPNNPSDLGLVEGLTSRVTHFAAVPGVFWAWFRPERPPGNAPELLDTRLEGVVTRLSLGLPLISFYGNEYRTLRQSDDGRIIKAQVREKGSFGGYSLLLSVEIFLGT